MSHLKDSTYWFENKDGNIHFISGMGDDEDINKDGNIHFISGMEDDQDICVVTKFVRQTKTLIETNV
jgi:hypothetical protein